jgi:glycerate kinase
MSRTEEVGDRWLVAIPDKFRGTLTAHEAASAMAEAGTSMHWPSRQCPLSDGGDGLVDVLRAGGGETRSVVVEGPHGAPVEADWLLYDDLAVVEMARASGLALAGGAEANDVLGATTRGTGELIVDAARTLRGSGEPSPGQRIVVGLGGSATTDGGLGAMMAIEEAGGLAGVELIGACDVAVGFDEAVTTFARQKGATDQQLQALAERFDRLISDYRDRFGIDVRDVVGAGAAGGLGAAIALLGGQLRSGYEIVADLVGLDAALVGATVVVTGEGSFDRTSFAGKVVGSVLGEAVSRGLSCLVIAGRVDGVARERAEGLGAHVISLADRFGELRSLADTRACIVEAVADYLANY